VRHERPVRDDPARARGDPHRGWRDRRRRHAPTPSTRRSRGQAQGRDDGDRRARPRAEPGVPAHLLDESEMPTQWYNIVPDLPTPPPPPLHPGTLQPVGPDDLAPLFPMDLILQEVTRTATSTSPARCSTSTGSGGRRRCTARTGWRRRSAPRPGSTTSTRASRPAGSHKPNTAVPQAYYNAKAGVRKLTTETGAGQWGTALAFACAPSASSARCGRSGVLRPEAVPPLS
jgi:hypothetical protein